MVKNQVNDAVFEAIFRQAVIDDFEEEISSISSDEQLAKMYSLSPEFEIRMKKLFIKDSIISIFKTVIYYSKKIALLFIILIGLLFATLLFNTEVRATVVKVLVEWYGKFTTFTYGDDIGAYEKKDWTLNYLPEGYIEGKNEILGEVINIEFINNKGDKIRFSYRPEDSNTKISVDNEKHKIDSCTILNNDAYCISAVDDRFENGIICSMKGYTFSIWGKLSIEEIIQIAESISEEK